MHTDRISDRLEIERSQMLHTVGKEPILLADDFGCYLENGLGALVEGAHEPGGRLQTIGKIAAVVLARRAAGDLGMIALVHQHFRERVGIELYAKTAVRPLVPAHITPDRLTHHVPHSHTP